MGEGKGPKRRSVLRSSGGAELFSGRRRGDHHTKRRGGAAVGVAWRCPARTAPASPRQDRRSVRPLRPRPLGPEVASAGDTASQPHIESILCSVLGCPAERLVRRLREMRCVRPLSALQRSGAAWPASCGAARAAHTCSGPGWQDSLLETRPGPNKTTQVSTHRLPLRPS